MRIPPPKPTLTEVNLPEQTGKFRSISFNFLRELFDINSHLDSYGLRLHLRSRLRTCLHIKPQRHFTALYSLESLPDSLLYIVLSSLYPCAISIATAVHLSSSQFCLLHDTQPLEGIGPKRQRPTPRTIKLLDLESINGVSMQLGRFSR